MISMRGQKQITKEYCGSGSNGKLLLGWLARPDFFVQFLITSNTVE